MTKSWDQLLGIIFLVLAWIILGTVIGITLITDDDYFKPPICPIMEDKDGGIPNPQPTQTNRL